MSKKHRTTLGSAVVVGFLLQFAVPTFIWAKTPAKKSDSALSDLQLKEGDERANEVKAAKAELMVRNTEDMALKQIQTLLAKHKNTPMEVELLFRRGELYMRRAKTERFFEVHRESETISKLLPRRVKAASQKREITNAISTYEEIRKRFPGFDRKDLVLFNNAFARQLINDDKGAEALYWEIVHKHNSSPLVPDAHLAIGEINFENKNFKHALDHFNMISKYPSSRAYSYGLYKSAWTYYNLQQAPEALAKLEEVVRHGQHVADERLDERLDLRKEALRDMALFYSETRPSGQAVSYFVKQSRELDASQYVMTLANVYERHGKLKDIETVLKDLIDKIPKSEKIPDAYDKLVWNFERGLNREKAVIQLGAYDEYCQELKADKTDPRVQTCQNLLLETSEKLATKWHGLWSKNNKHPLFSKAAAVAYDIYLRRAPPQAEQLAQMHFNYGEMLFNNGDLRKASEQYALVRGAKPNKQLLHDGDYAAIVALEKAVNDKWTDADEKKFQDLVASYVTDNPKGTYVLDVTFQKAMIAYKKHRYAEAQPQFRDIGWKFPQSEQGRKAQDLYLDILNINKDFAGLKKASKELLALKPTGEREKDLKKVYQQSYFAEIQNLEDKKAIASLEAAKQFMVFSKENLDSPLAPQAMWNAITTYKQEGMLKETADTCQELPKLFPKFEKNTECLVLAAKAYEDLGLIEPAADTLALLATRDAAKTTQYRELSADFYSLAGQKTRALTIYEDLLNKEKSKAERSRLLEKIYQTAKKANHTKYEKLAYDLMIKEEVEPFASKVSSEKAMSTYKSGQFTEAFRLASRVVGNKGAASGSKAEARYVQAMILKKEFEDQSVKSRPDRLAMVIAMKTEKLEKAQRAFEATLAYKDSEYAVKALQQLSNIYVTYSRTLKNIPLPPELPQADRNALMSEMENLAMPLEEKGIETMAQAVQLAQQLNLHDGQLEELQNELDKLNMKKTVRPKVELHTPKPVGPKFAAFGGILR